jgi:RNA polymerase sigma-70 factor, ECF subfamily
MCALSMPSERGEQARTPEEAVLARVAMRDASAVRECLARYGGLVWSIARRFSPTDADDAVQEIFLDLWKNAGRYDPAIASEPVFVAMIARRRLIDRRRRAKRDASTSPSARPPSIPDPASGPEVCAEASQAARALMQLRPEERDVLLQATCLGMSHEEIARQTGQPLGTIKSLARRGLFRIRALLAGVDGQEEHS